MWKCEFELNGQPLSKFKYGAKAIDAFSGMGANVNRRSAACLANVGPIPSGTYYIVDRQSGGLLGPLYDLMGRHDSWFSLYAADRKIDDETFCNEVRRGNFRLHPKGALGVSRGCITIERLSDFTLMRAVLLGKAKQPIPGSALRAYGYVVVK